MLKKISIAILSIIFIFVLAPAVFASTYEMRNQAIPNGTGEISVNLGTNRVFSSFDILVQPLSGDWSGTSCPDINRICSVSNNSIFDGVTVINVYNGDSIDGIANIFLIGEYVGTGNASGDLTTIMGAIITSSVDLTTSVFTTYWPYVLVIGIIGALIIVFVRLFKVFR